MNATRAGSALALLVVMTGTANALPSGDYWPWDHIEDYVMCGDTVEFSGSGTWSYGLTVETALQCSLLTPNLSIKLAGADGAGHGGVSLVADASVGDGTERDLTWDDIGLGYTCHAAWAIDKLATVNDIDIIDSHQGGEANTVFNVLEPEEMQEEGLLGLVLRQDEQS